MAEEGTTKEQLLKKIKRLEERVSELEKMEIEHKQGFVLLLQNETKRWGEFIGASFSCWSTEGHGHGRYFLTCGISENMVYLNQPGGGL